MGLCSILYRDRESFEKEFGEKIMGEKAANRDL